MNRMEPAAGSFRARVWEIVRAVPPGRVVSYGDVAMLSGDRKAARAVGGAGWAGSSGSCSHGKRHTCVCTSWTVTRRGRARQGAFWSSVVGGGEVVDAKACRDALLLALSLHCEASGPLWRRGAEHARRRARRAPRSTAMLSSSRSFSSTAHASSPAQWCRAPPPPAACGLRAAAARADSAGAVQGGRRRVEGRAGVLVSAVFVRMCACVLRVRECRRVVARTACRSAGEGGHQELPVTLQSLPRETRCGVLLFRVLRACALVHCACSLERLCVLRGRLTRATARSLVGECSPRLAVVQQLCGSCLVVAAPARAGRWCPSSTREECWRRTRTVGCGARLAARRLCTCTVLRLDCLRLTRCAAL